MSYIRVDKGPRTETYLPREREPLPTAAARIIPVKHMKYDVLLDSQRTSQPVSRAAWSVMGYRILHFGLLACSPGCLTQIQGLSDCQNPSTDHSESRETHCDCEM